MRILIISIFFAVSYAMPNRRSEEDVVLKAFKGYRCVVDSDLGNKYIVPHPFFCDQFYRCSEGSRELQGCRDGYGLDLKTGECKTVDDISCGKRNRLYATSHDNLIKCPFRNGLFPILNECESYTDCRDGKDYLRSCSSGLVFDDQLGACVHPDQTTREDCLASKFLNFECPELVFDDNGFLPFGDHDRVAHPSECNKFFSCDFGGQPRLNGCPEPTVFNPKTGFCVEADQVTGCEDFYGGPVDWKVGTLRLSQ